MITINLYPWREYRITRSTRQFNLSLMTVVVATSIIALILMHLQTKKIQRVTQANHIYQQTVSKLNHDLNRQRNDMQLREDILRRLEIFKKVNDNREILIGFMNGMTAVLPDDSYYTNAFFSDNTFLLEGKVKSNVQLSSLLENIKAKDWSILLNNSKITENADQDISPISFRIQIMMN